MNTASKPFALYIHIPWCVKKCPYCDFNSHESHKEIPETDYLEALIQDLDSELQYVSERKISSIFFGGGTPSLISPDFYLELLEQIKKRAEFTDSIEITLEANPGTADAANFCGYKNAGINRLSMGFQSLNDANLKALGRIHDASQAKKAFQIARDAGFDNINIDLMFGLPGQSTKASLADLSEVVRLNPEHISWYQLTLEPNTLFYAQPPANLPDNDLAWQMQNEGIELLNANGFQRYEISAFSKPGLECHHNLNYWLYGDYLGIGAGAHGKYYVLENGFIRTSKQRHPTRYLAGNYQSSKTELNKEDIVAEFFLNRLRLFTGFSAIEFQEVTGCSLDLVESPLNQAIQKKLLYKQGDKFRPTALGYQFLNDLISLFL